MRNSEEGCPVRRLCCIQDSPSLTTAEVAHKIYGIPQTINSANYVYFLAYQELFSLRAGTAVDEDVGQRLVPFKELDRIVTGNTRCSIPSNPLTHLAAELLSLHRGQGLELLWRDSLQCPTEAEYVSMVNDSQLNFARRE